MLPEAAVEAGGGGDGEADREGEERVDDDRARKVGGPRERLHLQG